MSKLSETPDKLKPYVFHGVDLSWNSEEATSDCPFCGRPKFSVNVKTGVARCWGCPVLSEKTEKGGINCHSFMELFWNHCDKKDIDYQPLAEERGLHPETLMHWGVVRSVLTNEWLVPGYNVQGKVAQLYRLVTSQDKRKLWATPTINHKLYGVNLYDKSKPSILLCEGPWDGMALWETLGGFKYNTDNELMLTANRAQSLLSGYNILAVPGCEVFHSSWTILFAGKEVTILFDNDHPKVNPKTGKMYTMSSTITAIQRLAVALHSDKHIPQSINYLKWSNDDETHYAAELPSGYDVRDHLITK